MLVPSTSATTKIDRRPDLALVPEKRSDSEGLRGADQRRIAVKLAAGLALKDSKRWDDSIGEFRKVLAMRHGADPAIWVDATDGMNALCHGQSPQAYSSQYVFLLILLRTRNKRRLAYLVTGQSI